MSLEDLYPIAFNKGLWLAEPIMEVWLLTEEEAIERLKYDVRVTSITPIPNTELSRLLYE
jgi:hypothetical protein